ncbi:hypothetical protein F9L16_15950 [Agarivorans sp. B2Z047]|uniref:hypothetical protein n=1 Tax=Agarivorans sp. B2Z047 TaxID=2652721 RepID=UPI00128AE10F|nr:hypothetical protein [Agarivorans sp. B2Z047]MPW30480.1 hypothetical protein [Agarivorans sp. B2Z047]UQN42300.1 hypothetical protein LQZ07_21395 [Agarivorans sp. B2Z047]
MSNKEPTIDKIETALKASYGATVALRVDGRKLIIQLAEVKENQLNYVVHLAASLRWAIGRPNLEEYDPLTQKVWRKRSRQRATQAQRRDIEKAIGKRRAKKEYPEAYETAEWYEPLWPTLAPLIRALKACDSVELLQDGPEGISDGTAYFLTKQMIDWVFPPKERSNAKPV